VPVPPEQGFAQGESTTVGVVVTNARLTKLDCLLVAQSGHDGMGRALDPAHTAGDGDALIAAATGAVDASPWVVRSLATHVVEAAIRQVLTSHLGGGPYPDA